MDKFSVHLENVWDKKVFPSRYGKPQAKTLGFLVKKNHVLSWKVDLYLWKNISNQLRSTYMKKLSDI